MSVETTGAAQGIVQLAGSRVRDYLALLKPRVMSLVVFTGFHWSGCGTRQSVSVAGCGGCAVHRGRRGGGRINQ